MRILRFHGLLQYHLRMRAFFMAAALLAGATPASSQQSVSEQRPQPVLENGELMALVIRPAYVEVQTLIAKPPADRREWAAVYQKLARLAEFENLLFFRAHERTLTPEWQRLAAGARDASAAAGGRGVNRAWQRWRAGFQRVAREVHRYFRILQRLPSGLWQTGSAGYQTVIVYLMLDVVTALSVNTTSWPSMRSAGRRRNLANPAI